MPLPTKIPAGRLFTVTTGEHDSYHVVGLYMALKDVETSAHLEGYLHDHPGDRDPYSFQQDVFLAVLSNAGIIKAIDGAEWCLSDRYRADISSELLIY